MGSNEEGKSTKPDKSSSPAARDQTSIHVYPDWAPMQAYYGPRIALPPYYSPAMASGHTPHPYIWAPPQPMMPPYGTPYAAVYSHGGVYAHPAVPIVSRPPGPGVMSSPAAVTPVSVETSIKTTGYADQGLTKKLKGFDGLEMSIGNGHGKEESSDGGERWLSQSSETEGSGNGSDGNTTGGRKRSREGTPTVGREIRTETQVNSVPAGETNASSEKSLALAVPPAGISGKSAGPIISPGLCTSLELQNSAMSATKKNTVATNVQTCAVLPSETWLQNDKELKRERRKQSNRESARRSRLRKQAETEDLSHKVQSLTSENVALKSEIHQMSVKSEKIRLENAALMEKLKDAQLGHRQDIMSSNGDKRRPCAVSTENLLSRVDNSANVNRNTVEDDDLCKKNSNSGTKLHQLLSKSPRVDVVAAS